MDHVLAEQGLRLTYLRDSRTIDALDHELILEDLVEGTPSGEQPACGVRSVLSDYDHLVLASDVETGQVLGLLGGRDGDCATGTFLLLETGFVVASARGTNLLRRMTALALLRIAGLGALPGSVVALTRNPAGYHVLRTMSQALSGTKFAPAPDEGVVSIADALLIRDIAVALGHPLHYGAMLAALRAVPPAAVRLQQPSGVTHTASIFASRLTEEPILAALDLRGAPEARLLADVRRLYRTKARRPTVHAAAAVARNPVWPAARQPRPRAL